ncbi:MAG: hypothetical protein GTO12_26630 [Proteobacteria bacterium]|nr:hypothetical protein [Pseudomonadota bacterium]
MKEEIPHSMAALLSLSDVAEAVGDPSRMSRKGKTAPLERGRGRNSPPANPERVTA